MALEIKVNESLKRLEADLGLYAEEALAAGIRAQNRAMVTVRAEAVKAMRKDLPGLKASAIRARIKLIKATKSKPAAAAEFGPGRFRLWGNFVTRQTKGGVPTSRLPWRIETLDGDTVPTEALRHAFIQRPRRGGVPHVWVRVGGQRYPITALLAPGLSTQLIAQKLGDALVALGIARFRKTFDQEAKFRLNKRGAL